MRGQQGMDFFTEGSVIMDYCDVFIICLDCQSDGTHSLQRINWWASDLMQLFLQNFHFFPMNYSINVQLHLLLNFHGQNSVISIWIFAIRNIMQGDKGFPPVDFAKGPSWSHKFAALTNRKLLGLKVTSVLRKQLPRYMTDNRQWTFLPANFLQNIANVTTPLH